MHELVSVVMQQAGLPPAKAEELVESILIYIKTFAPQAGTLEIDRIIANVKRHDTPDLFNEARETFFGVVDTPSGFDN